MGLGEDESTPMSSLPITSVASTETLTSISPSPIIGSGIEPSVEEDESTPISSLPGSIVPTMSLTTSPVVGADESVLTSSLPITPTETIMPQPVMSSSLAQQTAFSSILDPLSSSPESSILLSIGPSSTADTATITVASTTAFDETSFSMDTIVSETLEVSLPRVSSVTSTPSTIVEVSCSNAAVHYRPHFFSNFVQVSSTPPSPSPTPPPPVTPLIPVAVSMNGTMDGFLAYEITASDLVDR